MSEAYLINNLKILNEVYNNTLNYEFLNNTYNYISFEKDKLKTKLLKHQETMVAGMYNYKEKMTKGFLYNNQAINGKLGVISDPPGSGKTLSVLAYLTIKENDTSLIGTELVSNSSKYFFSHNIFENKNNNYINLIIVPNLLFSHWKNEIINHTNLNFVYVESKRLFKDNKLADEINTKKLVLTTSKVFKYLQEYCNNYDIHWGNVFIDDASHIYFNSNTEQIKFKFLWFITNNYFPFIFKYKIKKNEIKNIIENNQLNENSKKINNLHPELLEWINTEDTENDFNSSIVSALYFKDYLPYNHDLRFLIILRNSQKELIKNIYTSNINIIKYKCKSNLTINSLIQYLKLKNKDLTCLNDNIFDLLQALNIRCFNTEDLFNEIDESKHRLITHKINENECMICLEKAEFTCITNCCYNIYCFKCLLQSLIFNKKCPICRFNLSLNDVYCINENNYNNEELLNKVDKCIDIIKQNKNKNKNNKFIIYSSFHSTFFQMYYEFCKLNIKADRLENNQYLILKSIKKFNDGETDVLFISNIDLIRGLSLTSASHLIFFHEIPSYDLKQILIHSVQRLGKKNHFDVIHLNSDLSI